MQMALARVVAPRSHPPFWGELLISVTIRQTRRNAMILQAKTIVIWIA